MSRRSKPVQVIEQPRGDFATHYGSSSPWKAKSAGSTWGISDAHRSIKKAFVDKGIPVILGEYAAGLKPKYPDMKSFRDNWVRYVTRSAYRHGLVPMYWDIELPEGMFNRSTGAEQDPVLIKTSVEAVRP